MQFNYQASFFTTQRQIVLGTQEQRLLRAGPMRCTNKTAGRQAFLGPYRVGFAHEDVEIDKSSQGQIAIGIKREGGSLVRNCLNPRGFKRLENPAQLRS